MVDIKEIYRAYLDCLNTRELKRLPNFVHDNVCYNGDQIGLEGYQRMISDNYRDIPDLYFDAELLLSDDPFIACRLQFTCAPIGTFLGLPVNGKTISFCENVFYRFREDKIEEVWSVIDKVAIERQL